MKIYIAARWPRKDEVEKLYNIFRDMGHEITTDWTKHKPVKPYDKNPEISKEYAIADLNGAMNSDVFILLSSEEGTGMNIEFGAAMAQTLRTGKPKVYVVGDHVARSMFYFHPKVERRKTIDEVIKEIREKKV